MFFIMGSCSSSLLSWRSERIKRREVRCIQVSCLLATANVIFVYYLSGSALLLLLSSVCLFLWPLLLLLLLLCTHRCSCTLTEEKKRNHVFRHRPCQKKLRVRLRVTGVWLVLTWSLWCGGMSLVEGRSLLMSWPIILKVGLSVGSRLQQSVISWYLRGQVSVRFKITLLTLKECLSVSSHLCWSKVWLIHVAAIFDHLVEVGIYNNVWVGTLT